MLNAPFAGIKRPSLPRGSARTIIQVELLALLLGAVALTVMPVEALGALAVALSWAHDFALAYRPAVAFVGLLLVGVLTWSAFVLTRPVAGTKGSLAEAADKRSEVLGRAA